MTDKTLISIVIPAYNEAVGIEHFYNSLSKVLANLKDYRFELIIVDDGSRDKTASVVRELAKKNPNIRFVCLSRNFGKEAATTAGIQVARGNAIITIDADGQHPVELIPTFIEHWRSGKKVIIGVRSSNEKEGFTKRVGSRWFYRMFNRVAGLKVIPGSTDYRLIDRAVQTEFLRMSEHNRITRVLIDWLGYERELIEFKARAREHGVASYDNKKLVQLAIDSLISHSSSPLYFASYLGILILPLSFVLGIALVGDALLGDPLNWNISGSAYVIVLMLALVGVLLISQGIIGLYLSQIQTEAKNRPLFVIDESRSIDA